MAVHLSRSGRRKRQSTDHSRRHADQSGADLLGRDEQLLCAAAWQPDLHHGGNGHPDSRNEGLWKKTSLSFTDTEPYVRRGCRTEFFHFDPNSTILPARERSAPRIVTAASRTAS